MFPSKMSKRKIEIDADGTEPVDDGIANDAQEPEVPSAYERAVGRAEKAEIGSLKLKIDELQGENNSIRDEINRERAKFQNLRRRADEERAEALKYSIYDMAFDLLNVRDCFEMGLSCSTDIQHEELRPYIEGVKFTLVELDKVLKKHGVVEIPTDIPYDPELHQVFECIEEPGTESGTILKVSRKGYRLYDRILRTALVSVAGPGKPCENQGEK